MATRRKTGGRRKGTLNKFTSTVKEVFSSVFAGLQKSKNKDVTLAGWAKNNPTEFYKLASKLIPSEISGPNGGPIQTQQIPDGVDWLGFPIKPDEPV